MTKKFWKAVGIRALHTLCQSILGGIGTALILSEVNWKYVISASTLACIVSIVKSILVGLPEVDE